MGSQLSLVLASFPHSHAHIHVETLLILTYAIIAKLPALPLSVPFETVLKEILETVLKVGSSGSGRYIELVVGVSVVLRMLGPGK